MKEFDIWNGVTMKYEGRVAADDADQALNYVREHGTPIPIVCDHNETRSTDRTREFSRIYA